VFRNIGLLTTVLFASTCFAQQPAGAIGASDGIAKQFIRDEVRIWTSPSHIKRDDIGWISAFTVNTAILLNKDRAISQEIAENRGWNPPSHFVSSLGGVPVFAIPAGMLAVGKLSHHDELAATGSLGLRAVVHATVVAQVAKAIAGRERPTEGSGLGRFRQGGSSFPSGHSMASWALATVIAKRSNNKWIKLGSYSFATAVGMSRIGGRNHFPSDALVGSTGGYLIGRYMARN
jgi:membrane-associated phospholipid phosphatase